jgi:hypothetical protein
VYVSQPSSEDAEVLNSGTPAGLYKFFDIAIKRGDLAQASGVALRTGCRKVLDIEDNDQLDLRTLDQEDLLRRFHVKSKVDLNDKSRATYEARFRRAVDMYLKYLDGDPSWKPPPQRATSSKSGSTGKPSTPKSPDVPPPNANTDPSPPPLGMIEFPIPLRPGVQGKLVLPENLTQKEAKRVVAVVTALAMEEQLAITAGPSDE